MIVDITSFGWSGSGAYHDLLREYDDVEFPYKGDWEFHFLWAVDGLYDLEEKLCKKHCRVYDSDLAISRFLNFARKCDSCAFLGYQQVFGSHVFRKLCEEFVEDITDIKINGRCFNDIIHPNKKEWISTIYNKTVGRILSNRLTRKIGLDNITSKMMMYNPHLMRISYNPENFLEKARLFVEKLLSRIRMDDEKILIMDQMFPPDVPFLFHKYVKEEHKIIIVRRDPRDTYIAMRKMSNFPYPIPSNVKDFIWFYKKIVAESLLPNTDYQLSLNFEDLIYEYDNTVKKIENFIGLTRHRKPYSKFKPDISKNNTQLKTLYPEFSTEIALIEKELSDYLYPFERYDFQRTSNMIF